MECGILYHEKSRTLFEKLNTRPLCQQCQNERSAYTNDDMKGWPLYLSNMLPGFSSQKIAIPLDVLVVAESHGGREDYFRPQKDLDSEVISHNRIDSNLLYSSFPITGTKLTHQMIRRQVCTRHHLLNCFLGWW
jgi:hypothetical protein